MKGTTILLNLVLVGLSAISAEAVFARDELETVLSGLRLFKIRHCTLSSEVIDETTEYTVQKLNENLVLTSFVEVELLEEYVKLIKPPDELIAIVIKVGKSSQVKDVFLKNSLKLSWFVWFLFTNDDLDPRIRIPYNCQLFHIKRGSRRSYRLIESFHVKNSSVMRQEFGLWTPENGLTTASVHIYSRRRDMKGVELLITVCLRYKLEEVIKLFWIDLAKIFNFSVKMEPELLKKTPGGYVPVQHPDGSSCIWGITGLESDKDWVFSTFGDKVKLIMKFRGTNEVGWRAYVQPFTREMWLAVILWLLLSTAAIVIVNGCTREALYLNLFTGFFCLCNSDPTAVYPAKEPLPIPTKLVYLMAVVVPAVIVPAYSAYILSTLSIIRPLEPFSNLRSFIEDSTYRLTAVNHSFTIRLLTGSRDPEIKYIYNNLFVGADNAAPTFSALFEQLCENNQLVGLFVDSKDFINHFRCRMYIVQQGILSIGSGFLLSNDSPLRKMLQERFLQYHERGLKRRPQNPRPGYNKDPHESGLNALNMSQMAAIFFIVPLGVFMALIFLAAELGVKKHFQQTAKAVPYNSAAEHCVGVDDYFQTRNRHFLTAPILGSCIYSTLCVNLFNIPVFLSFMSRITYITGMKIMTFN